MKPIDIIREKFGKVKPKPKQVKTKKVIAYLRISHPRQAEGESIDTQRKGIMEYAIKKGYTIVKTLEYEGESSKTGANRPSIKKLFEILEKPKNDISNVLVWDTYRFGRDTGFGIQTIDKLIRLGVGLIDVSEPQDIFTDSGRIREIEKFLDAEKENLKRKKYGQANTLALLEKGCTVTKPKFGYSRDPNDKSNIYINEEGKTLKNAFKIKMSQRITNVELAERLNNLGLKIDAKKLSEIFSNPYYCGLIKDVRLEEYNGIIEGNHPAMITQEDFLFINGLRNENRLNKKKTDRKELPLRRHLVCAKCGGNISGEFKKKKNQAYYKCGTKGCKMNINVKKVHPLYIDLLKQLSVDEKYIPIIENELGDYFSMLNDENSDKQFFLREKIKDAEKRIHEIYVNMGRHIENSDYYISTIKVIEGEIEGYKKELLEVGAILPNLSYEISEAIKLANELADIWEQGDLETRVNLQPLVFPDGVVFDKEKIELTPVSINPIFDLISGLSRGLSLNSIEPSPKDSGSGNDEVKNLNRTSTGGGKNNEPPKNSGGSEGLGNEIPSSKKVIYKLEVPFSITSNYIPLLTHDDLPLYKHNNKPLLTHDNNPSNLSFESNDILSSINKLKGFTSTYKYGKKR